MVNGRLLLLLQFSSAIFLPIVVLALLFTSSGIEIFGFPERPESSEGFLFPVVTSVTAGAVWKNLCRADCVFWAEAVQDLVGGTGLAGFAAIFTGASSTEEGSGAGWVWLVLYDCPEMTGPALTPGSEEEGLQLLWWALQIKVSGFFPGLYPPA